MQLDRRTFLRSAGVALALPVFDALVPSHARATAAGSVPRLEIVNHGGRRRQPLIRTRIEVVAHGVSGPH